MQWRQLSALPCTAAVVAMVLLLQPGQALSFTGEDDATPGAAALRYNRKPTSWGRVDMGYEDGRIKTSPPGSVTVDRRLEALAILGFDAPLGGGSDLRINVDASYSKQRQLQEQQPQATTDQTLQVYQPSADFTFVTEKGLELVIGAMEQLMPAYNSTLSNANGTSSSHYHATTILSPRASVIRRSSQWAGGFFYQSGSRLNRNIDQHAFDGSTGEALDEVFLPSIIGVMGNFHALSTLWNFELDFVQARDIGPQDGNGHQLYTDYFRALTGGAFDFGGAGLQWGLDYQTQSYGNSAFVTLDTIPVANLRLIAFFGSPTQNVYVGLIGAYGKDGQSLPEFNASYDMYGLAATAGYVASW